MNGPENVEVAKGQDLSVIITKGERRLSANAFLALELVFFLLFLIFTSMTITRQWTPKYQDEASS